MKLTADYLKHNCLAITHPELCKEWHPTKNGCKTPFDISKGHDKKVWWECSKGHEWEADVYSRANGCGCPYCSGRFATSANSLTNKPEVVKYWHHAKNLGISPETVCCNSDKSFWWKCPVSDDHEWRTRPRYLNGCPFCSNHKVAFSNCLAVVNPKLAAEWHHTKNGNLTAYDVVAGGDKKIWWKCTVADDEWQATIFNRINGRGCHCCSSKKVVKSNCLATVCPNIAKEWHPVKNGNLTPHDVCRSGIKKIWWTCEQGHEWLVSLNARSKTGCPFCNESKGEKSIANVLKEIGILFRRQEKFPSCRDAYPLPFDFAIYHMNRVVLIEYQGKQHYKQVEHFGGEEGFKKTVLHDSIKRDWCKCRGVPLLEISYLEHNNIRPLIIDFLSTLTAKTAI